MKNKVAVLLAVAFVMGGVRVEFDGSNCRLTSRGSRAFGAEEKVPEADQVPEGMKGFRGMFQGTLVSKGEKASFVVKVEKIGKVWEKQNEAKNPESAVGKNLRLILRDSGRLTAELKQSLSGLKPGDKVEVEAFHYGGDKLTVMEVLRKVE